MRGGQERLWVPLVSGIGSRTHQYWEATGRRATMQMAAAPEKTAAQGMTLSYAWGAAHVAWAFRKSRKLLASMARR